MSGRTVAAQAQADREEGGGGAVREESMMDQELKDYFDGMEKRFTAMEIRLDAKIDGAVQLLLGEIGNRFGEVRERFDRIETRLDRRPD